MAVPRSCWLLALLLATAAPGGQLYLQAKTSCSTEQHYEYSGRCCLKCEPGKYVAQKCTAFSETVCRPCGSNEYMDIWNEEEKCFLHKICDRGKALIEVIPGNSTSQRQCACTAGYHWNKDCDCCRRNTKCAPGSGVKFPIQQDKNTVCVRCPTGYFSNVSSATDPCKSWTNCTALGTEEKIPGNTWSDAVCKIQEKTHSEDVFHFPENKKLFYVLIVPFLLIALAGIIILTVYYRSKGKLLTDLQYWAQEICHQIKGKKDSSCDTFVNTNAAHPAGLQLLGDTYLVDPDKYCFPDEMHYPCEHLLGRKDDPEKILYGSGGNFPPLFLTTISEDDHLRQIPMEDEYTDKVSHGQCYLPLVSQSDSKPTSPFSEPLEVGENDSLNYFFTGTENLEELGPCCCLDPPCAMDPLQASSHKYLPGSCNHFTCAKRREVDNEDAGTSRLLSEEKQSFATSSSRQPPNELDNAADSLKENGSPLLGTCGLKSSSLDQSGPPNNIGDQSDSPDVGKDQNTKRTSESSYNASDPPAASGNVTGNGNSTFISSGQVMNFKGEIIFVYVTQNSQEGSMSPGSSDDSLGNPVQEENLHRCETFAGNSEQYKEKCAEINRYHSMESGEPQSTVEGYRRTFGPIGQEENCESQKKPFSPEGSQPIQEEGKPGYS
ncbi:tumor necrosis factor receptor superfamily member 11A isoform X2 [Thamnophis elegans]|uniref:tumor necrosis factor receptor superfamily member 11A isoform X2 n=1 Tax=Thamnophis elegans TaxID=35005 RepID=UPI001377ED82|nr:tumor necrosis factor receptor superfamily member 11A isoform X2 [Thamnophis elegans]